MNKSELIDTIHNKLNSAAGENSEKIAKTDIGKVLNAFTESVSDTLAEGKDIVLVGFGTFSVKERAARTGRNPRTGEELQIAASKVPSFKAGKGLKDAVNNQKATKKNKK